MRTIVRLPVSAFIASMTLCLANANAQSIQSYSPYWALNQVNSNNIWPYSTSPMRYMQIHDWDSFSYQGPTIIRGIRYRPSLQSFAWNQSGATVDVEIRMALAPVGHTSAKRSLTFDNNWDKTTIKTVISRKKISYPASAGTLAQNQVFMHKFPFDASATFLYLPTQQRALVVETKQWGTPRGHAFDWWNSTATARGGYSHLNGSYLGCKAKNGQVVTQTADGAALYIGSTQATITSMGHAPQIPALVSLGTQALAVTLPGTSCTIMNDPLFLIPGVTDSSASGVFKLTFSVPNVQSLIRARFYSQAFFVEPGANSFGITASNGLVNGIGRGSTPGGSISRIWYLGNPSNAAASTALSSAQNGLVTMFHN